MKRSVMVHVTSFLVRLSVVSHPQRKGHAREQEHCHTDSSATEFLFTTQHSLTAEQDRWRKDQWLVMVDQKSTRKMEMNGDSFNGGSLRCETGIKIPDIYIYIYENLPHTGACPQMTTVAGVASFWNKEPGSFQSPMWMLGPSTWAFFYCHPMCISKD